jgi:hypothetical protein
MAMILWRKTAMYTQAAIKPNSLLCNGAYGIVERGCEKMHLCGCIVKE